MSEKSAHPGLPRTVVIVPDSFKGTASAGEVAKAMVSGVAQAACSLDLECEIRSLPFADGGEGTLDAFLAAWGVDAYFVPTTDALGRDISARYGISPDGQIAVVEAAEANGLPLVSDRDLRPLEATTYGVGTILAAVFDHGVKEIILCLGGSATTDGGAGLLAALGAKFMDATGQELSPGGGSLSSLADISIAHLDSRVSEVMWKVACDVTNPLTGNRGAAHVFGSQKGATREQREFLDQGLEQLVRIIAASTGRELAEIPGMGAAGGLATTLSAFANVELIPGWELVAQTLSAHKLLEGADLVFTGEGRLDSQSLEGKVVSGVLHMSAEKSAVVVFAGSVDLSPEQLNEAGIAAAFSIAHGPASLDELRENTVGLISSTAYNVARMYLMGDRIS